jgi:hypothetical protein
VSVRFGFLIGAACAVSACSNLPPPAQQPVGPVRAGCAMSDRLCVLFRNQMSKEFEVRRLLVLLDGKVIFDHPGLPARTDHVVYSGVAGPGQHEMQLLLHMQRDHFHFEARSSHSFQVASTGPGPDRVVTVAYEMPVGRLEERPAIRYIEEPAVRPPRAATVWVSKNGDVALNGQPADVEAVGRAFETLSPRDVVVYGVDASPDSPHPNAKKVIDLMARGGFTVRLSTLRDFSDVVAPDGTLRPSSADPAANRTPAP